MLCMPHGFENVFFFIRTYLRRHLISFVTYLLCACFLCFPSFDYMCILNMPTYLDCLDCLVTQEDSQSQDLINIRNHVEVVSSAFVLSFTTRVCWPIVGTSTPQTDSGVESNWELSPLVRTLHTDCNFKFRIGAEMQNLQGVKKFHFFVHIPLSDHIVPPVCVNIWTLDGIYMLSMKCNLIVIRMCLTSVLNYKPHHKT